MARLTLCEHSLEMAFVDADTTNDLRVRPVLNYRLDGGWSAEVEIARVAIHRHDVGLYQFALPCYFIANKDWAALPPPPPGITARPYGESHVRVHFDLHWLYSRIMDFARDHHGEHLTMQQLQASVLWFWTRSAANASRAVSACFDLSDPRDALTDLALQHASTTNLVFNGCTLRDSTLPGLTPYDLRVAVLSGRDTMHAAIQALRDTNSDTSYYTGDADPHYAPKATTRFVRALRPLATSAVPKPEPTRRRVVRVTEELPHFPQSCCLYVAPAEPPSPSVAFEMTGDYTYRPFKVRRTSNCDLYTHPGDFVLIRRAGGVHRFLFIDRFSVTLGIANTQHMAAVIPVSVADDECAKTAPLSPMRGACPKMTRAIVGNPYFASSFQHAMHRRRYIRSRLILHSTALPPQPDDVPVLFRPGTILAVVRPSNYSRIGKRAVRDRAHHLSSVVAAFLDMGPNELLFEDDDAEPMHPVAPVPSKRRALSLDM